MLYNTKHRPMESQVTHFQLYTEVVSYEGGKNEKEDKIKMHTAKEPILANKIYA